MTKKELKPESVFRFFQEINNVPRPSKHEEKMIEYLVNFGNERGLETIKDEVGNVLMRKPATPGMEQKPTVILQSHMDMVCDKTYDREIDFLNDPIETYVDGEWLRAKGTTLGADDGIGCAMELALLDDDTIEHGPIVCLFTRDEEAGMTGANALTPEMVKGDYLINLDSEEEGEFCISCAGGKTTTAKFAFEKEEPSADLFFMHASLKGLAGGHSGVEIDKKRANAIKLIFRFLYLESQKTTLHLVDMTAGKLHNIITHNADVVIAVPAKDKEMVMADWNVFARDMEQEFFCTEKNMEWSMASHDAAPVIPIEASTRIIRALQAAHHGVLSISQDPALDNIVETSANIATVRTTDTDMTFVISQRSNTTSGLVNIVNTEKAIFELAGAEVSHSDGYPAWAMNPTSHIREVARQTWVELFGKEPKIVGIHAGLETALFAALRPELDMISMGPDMFGVHTPSERLSIPSVERVWRHILAMLKAI